MPGWQKRRIAKFWRYFQRSSATIFDFEKDQERIFDDLAREIRKIHRSLCFEIGRVENGVREFVVSPGSASTSRAARSSVVRRGARERKPREDVGVLVTHSIGRERRVRRVHIGLLAIVLLLGALALWATACRREGAAPPAAGGKSTVFVYVRIPEALDPVDRGRKYEIPLDEALRGAALGEVTGGGSLLTRDPSGGLEIEWVGLDVELVDLESGLPFLRTELSRLGAPPATRLEFERNGTKVQESLQRP